MYFMPKHNKLISRFYGIDHNMRLLITLAAAVISLAIWFLVIYQPLSIILASYQSEQKTLCEQRELVLAHQAACDQTTLQLEEKNNEFEQLYHSHGVQNSSKNLVSYLFATIEKHNLSLEFFTPSARDIDHDWYVVSTISLSVKGQYESIMLFFAELQKSKKLIKIPQTVLKKNQDNIFTAVCVVEFFRCKQKNPSTQKAEGLGG